MCHQGTNVGLDLMSVDPLDWSTDDICANKKSSQKGTRDFVYKDRTRTKLKVGEMLDDTNKQAKTCINKINKHAKMELKHRDPTRWHKVTKAISTRKQSMLSHT